MTTYITIQGDMWDAISYKVYGNEKYMGVLMCSNPHLLNTYIFEAGTVLTIPEINSEEESDKPAWR